MTSEQDEALVSASDKFEIVALAASAGGLQALSQVLSDLPADFPVPTIIVQLCSTSRHSIPIAC